MIKIYVHICSLGCPGQSLGWGDRQMRVQAIASHCPWQKGRQLAARCEPVCPDLTKDATETIKHLKTSIGVFRIFKSYRRRVWYVFR